MYDHELYRQKGIFIIINCKLLVQQKYQKVMLMSSLQLMVNE